jgi:putative peptidoglycan lipid II flippase
MNTLIFAFVPMMTERRRSERIALFHALTRLFFRLFSIVTLLVFCFAPWLIRVLAPGLDSAHMDTSAWILRIASLSTLAAGLSAVHSALLYTDRRFAPSAFYQASLNVFTIAGALGLWKLLGVYGFAIGYAVGAWAQFVIIYLSSRTGLSTQERHVFSVDWRELLAKPAFILIYASGLALNLTFTRAWATQSGPGVAAALEYCLRGVTVPLVILVNPLSNSLLPEIARLRTQLRFTQAFRLIDRTIGLAAFVAMTACGLAIIFREPAIALIYERGSFTAESTRLVSAVFLGLAPSLIGWSLLELASRSLFALDRPWLPIGAAVVSVLFNVTITFSMGSLDPQFLGIGPSVGLFAGFVVLSVLARTRRRLWLSPELTSLK